MRPYILITNDDGIYSPGLAASVKAVADLGELLIVAPRFQQTGMGRSFPRLTDSGMIEKIILEIDGIKYQGFGVYGSPAQAVAHAIMELADRKPDVCISGINYGENLGTCISCSGTLGAAFEAESHNVDALAVSLEVAVEYQHRADYPILDFERYGSILNKLTKLILQDGLPEGTNVLNVNIPSNADETTEVRITRQSRQNYFSFIKPQSRKLEKPFTMTSRLEVDAESLDRSSDIYAVYKDRVVSVTPLSWDQTARQGWEFNRPMDSMKMGKRDSDEQN